MLVYGYQYPLTVILKGFSTLEISRVKLLGVFTVISKDLKIGKLLTKLKFQKSNKNSLATNFFWAGGVFGDFLDGGIFWQKYVKRRSHSEHAMTTRELNCSVIHLQPPACYREGCEQGVPLALPAIIYNVCLLVITAHTNG